MKALSRLPINKKVAEPPSETVFGFSQWGRYGE